MIHTINIDKLIDRLKYAKANNLSVKLHNKTKDTPWNKSHAFITMYEAGGKCVVVSVVSKL